MGKRRAARKYDVIIVGGGAAGLAAGVYLGRYLRPTIILDEKKPRTRWHRPTAHNVLGFPSGIQRNQLLEWGRSHVAKYECVDFRQTTVTRLRKVRGGFEAVDVDGGRFIGLAVILAPGIEYELPSDIPGVLDYAGRAIWHCTECDGYKCRDKKIVVIGWSRGSVEMALNLTIWTKDVTLCTHGQECPLDREEKRKLKAAGIAIEPCKITRIRGNADDGILEGFELGDGSFLEAAGAFVNVGVAAPTELYKELPLELDGGRWIKVDHRMRTNIPRCYAAGDVIANGQTQLSVAMGSGATAAIWLHRELLPPAICLSGRDW